MTPSESFFHRRSATFAALALLISVAAAWHGLGFAMRTRSPGTAFAVRAAIVCVVSFVVCIYATLNLVRDARGGYSRGRCILAAVLLVLGLALSMWTGFGLAGFIIDESNRLASESPAPALPTFSVRSCHHRGLTC
jgi:hypothetical protein